MRDAPAPYPAIGQPRARILARSASLFFGEGLGIGDIFGVEGAPFLGAIWSSGLWRDIHGLVLRPIDSLRADRPQKRQSNHHLVSIPCISSWSRPRPPGEQYRAGHRADVKHVFGLDRRSRDDDSGRAGRRRSGPRRNGGAIVIKRYSDHAANERTFSPGCGPPSPSWPSASSSRNSNLFLALSATDPVHRLPSTHGMIGNVAGLALFVWAERPWCSPPSASAGSRATFDSEDVRPGSGGGMDIALAALLALLGATLFVYLVYTGAGARMMGARRRGRGPQFAWSRRHMMRVGRR